MPIRIEGFSQIQQMEVVVAGPEDANRLFIINGQFDYNLNVGGWASGWGTPVKETFSMWVGPMLTRKQFVRAIATASLAKIVILGPNTGAAGAQWYIMDVDADWDDESERVELRIEAQVYASGSGGTANILGFSFQVNILAALPAA
jgi:hypothetical protein